MTPNEETPTEINMDIRTPPDKEQILHCDNLFMVGSPAGFLMNFWQANPVIGAPEEGVPMEGTGLIVARLHIPLQAMGPIVDVIKGQWDNYVANAMPPEVEGT